MPTPPRIIWQVPEVNVNQQVTKAFSAIIRTGQNEIVNKEYRAQAKNAQNDVVRAEGEKEVTTLVLRSGESPPPIDTRNFLNTGACLTWEYDSTDGPQQEQLCSSATFNPIHSLILPIVINDSTFSPRKPQ